MREKLEEAWDSIARERGLSWATANTSRFTRLLDAEAWLDAAMMLWNGPVTISTNEPPAATVSGSSGWCYAPTPAEALLAAIEKART